MALLTIAGKSLITSLRRTSAYRSMECIHNYLTCNCNTDYVFASISRLPSTEEALELSEYKFVIAMTEYNRRIPIQNVMY